MNDRQAQALLRDVLRLFSALGSGMLDTENGVNIAAGCPQLFLKFLKIPICAGLCVLHLEQLVALSLERFEGWNLP